MSSPKSLLYFLLALALVRGLIYASVVPPWQAPDEPAQFERARAALTSAEWHSTSQKNPPLWYDDLSRALFASHFWDFVDDIRPAYSPAASLSQYVPLYQEIYKGQYGSRPAYAVIGGLLFLASHQEITLQLYLVRLNTVLMNVVIIWLAYLMTRTIFPKDIFLSLGVPILLLFIPQHAHMLSTVNNGNLAELLSLAALFFLIRGVIRGFSWSEVLLILLFSLAAMWTKATAYFLPFAIGTVALFYLWPYRRRWPWLLPLGLMMAALVYYFAPPRFHLLITDAWNHLQTDNFFLHPLVPWDLFRSFWALPGWLALQLHPGWYLLLVLLWLLAVVGLVIFIAKEWPDLMTRPYRPQVRALAVLAVAVVAAVGILLSWNGLTNSTVYRQGRSIYPVVVPICIFFMLGWRQLIPRPWRPFGLLAISLALFLFDTMVLFNYMIPFFYSRY
jgi:hypothetical protein